MSKNNVRIAIRDSTDSHNVAFFDNQAGIKYKSANLQRFLAGSASILTIKYNSKDIDTIRSGCKLAFCYKNRDYWLNVMSFEKKGFEVELTAYSLGLELNNETRGEHKPANAMSITEYVAYYDPEHALTIGVNEVSDKRIKLEWTGTDTILARLFSVANSFGAELDFNVELNDDYSLKRQVLNIYKKGNLGTNKVSQPVRVGKELKVINYSDNIKELRTAVRATGKDGLTIDGLDKKIYDNNKELLYYSSGMTVYAPQSRDRFPSVGKGSNDNWIVEDLGETQYETKEALWGYMYGEIQKKSLPEITYEVEGAIEAGIGDTQTLIDDIHFEPALYVQARVSELEDDILTGKVTKSTFINFERKYSQIADILLKQVEALAEDAAPYIIRLSTNNGYIFKNGEGSSTITARLEKYSKDIAATWKWVVDNKVVGTGDKLTIKAEQVTNTMAVTVIAYVNGNEVVRDYMTFSNSDDGVGVESIDRYFTSSDQSDGVTIEGAEWSDKPPAPTEDGKYLWAYDEITYTDGTVTTTKPAAVGANFDVDAFRAEIAEELKDVPDREEFENKIAEELANSKAEIETQIETAKTQAESNAKEYADTINQETAKVAELANAAADEIKADLVNVKNNLTATSLVANNAQAAVDEAKQDLAEVASELNTAKQDFANSVTAVNTKVDSTKAELTQAKQDLMSHAQQLQTQANAQTELTKRVTTVETTANGTKTTVNELTKTVAQNGKDIASVTNRTKTVEDDLANTKTTLTQVQTTANSASQKTATLETGLNGLTAKFDNLRVGGHNYLRGTSDQYQTLTSDNYLLGYTGNGNMSFLDLLKPLKGEIVTIKSYIKNDTDFPVRIQIWFTGGGIYGNPVPAHEEGYSVATGKILENFASCNIAFTQVGDGTKNGGTIWHKEDKLEKGNIATDYSPNEADIDSKVAEYKQTADQNYASLSSTVQTLDGQVQSNKTTAEQTAQGFKTRIESLETYKDGESERANAYFESAKTETAKQLTAERTAIANNYVAKSTYTSDVTGIRNELSATTSTANATKTNLANYQASNDKVVASLKSSLQTTDGNVSNLQTKVEAVPGQITSAVSAVEGKIPTSTGGRNYLRGTSDEYQTYTNTNYILGYPSTDRNWDKLLNPLRGKIVTLKAYIKNDTDYPVRIQMWFNGGGINGNAIPAHSEGWSVGTGKMSADWTSANVAYIQPGDNATGGTIQAKEAKLEIGNIPSDWSLAPEDYDSKLATAQSEIKQTTDSIKASVQSLDNSTVKSSSLTINTDGVVIKAGKSTSDFANAVGSYFSVNQNAINLFSDKINVKGNMIVSGAITSDKIASAQINTAHLNGKIITADVISSNAVTADAIKAGAVTTDKMSANSINGDRITAGTLDAAKIKAGSISASQIASGTLTSEQIKAGAIKSINIEASAITSDKIASNSIDASKIVTNGLTANIIKGGKLQSISNATNFELDTGKLFYNHNNTGVFRVQSGASTMGLKFTNTAITVNGSSKVLSRVILGGDRRESTLDDGKWDQGGFTGIVAETINGVASNAHDKADTLRAIGDNIYFTHSYETDALTGVSAAGWKMETYAPDTSYKGNVVLKPYGVSYRQSNIVVGDLRLDNGDGSGYWMRATINVLKACFGHIVNGGISSDALNAIKSELNKISGT
nr:MAG TPA: Neck appendage protein [Caudoviricetes sp.]